MPKKVKPILKIDDVDILTEIGSIGAGNATVALSKIINEPIKIEVPKMHLALPHLVAKMYNKHDMVVTAIFMQLRSEADCDIMLVLDAKEAKKIASSMVSSVCEGALTELEMSAIEELGSIMIGAFLSAIANFTQTELVPTPPRVINDSFDAVIDGLLVKQALCSDIAAVFDARFKREDGSAEGLLIMFPSQKLRRTLTIKGEQWLIEV